MILEQQYLACLSHASYLVGDEEAGVACVVDPRRDVDGYVERARELGVEIRHVVLTHFHADFVSGHIELARRTGAVIHLGARAKADYAFHALADGDEIPLGRVRLRALETPGHTPEGISLLVFDGRDAERPHAVLTGDTLFIGDVGRPDLMASVGVTAVELGEMLYDSLHEKLLPLPDETLVYPAHGAGSMCGKSLSKETVSTIGEQRELNYALQPMSKEAFVRLVASEQPDAPGYFSYDAALNRRERTTLDEALERSVKPLTPERVLALLDAGGQVLDARPRDAFARAHVAGSVNVGLDGRFATWCGSVLAPDRDLVVIAEPGREREAILRLGRVGFDRVAGYLAGGFEAARFDASRVGRLERVRPAELARRVAGAGAPRVFDVRSPGEYAAGHLEGSTLIPLQRLVERAAEVPDEGPVVVHCQTGYRSATAVSLLARAGYRNLVDLEGGFEAWEKAGLPTVTPEPAAG